MLPRRRAEGRGRERAPRRRPEPHAWHTLVLEGWGGVSTQGSPRGVGRASPLRVSWGPAPGGFLSRLGACPRGRGGSPRGQVTVRAARFPWRTPPGTIGWVEAWDYMIPSRGAPPHRYARRRGTIRSHVAAYRPAGSKGQPLQPLVTVRAEAWDYTIPCRGAPPRCCGGPAFSTAPVSDRGNLVRAEAWDYTIPCRGAPPRGCGGPAFSTALVSAEAWDYTIPCRGVPPRCPWGLPLRAS